MLTEKQIIAIQNMSFEDASQTFDELVERLGLVSQSEYMEAMGIKYNQSYINELMRLGKIPHKKIGKFRFPMINT